MEKKRLIDYSYQNLSYSCCSFFAHKWQLSIIVFLSSGPKNFGEIYRYNKGISKKVLCSNLNGLIKKNIVIREEFMDGKIKKTEYYLTKQGKELTTILEKLGAWGEKYYPDIELKNTKKTSN